MRTPSQSPPVCGLLDPFFETGTEGVIWSLVRLGVPGYDQLITLSDGARLRIIDPIGAIAWEGVVDFEYERTRRPYPGNPSQGQQAVRGMWVNGLQRSLPPDLWADLFFRRCPAVLVPTIADLWERQLVALDLLAAPPHEQVLSVLARGTEDVRHRLRHSFAAPLVIDTRDALGLPPTRLVDLLELSDTEAAPLRAGGDYPDLSGWSEAAISRALRLSCAVDYLRFAQGPAITWENCPALCALRTSTWTQVQANLASLQPTPVLLG